MVKINKGDVFPTNNSGDATVVEYINCRDVVVQFSDGRTKSVFAGDLRSGLIKNNYYPNVLGIGYLGDGEYMTRRSGTAMTAEYNAWTGMIARCYDEKSLSLHPTYIGCSVCEEWHNFQNFAGWYSKQKKSGSGWHLDKDLTVLGNKIYSPETCALIPQEVNKLLLTRKIIRGEYPQGVCTDKRYGTFSANIRKYGVRTYIGTYPTPEAAFTAYKKAKELHVKEVAEKFKQEISEAIYENLMNYTVSITD